MSSSSDETLLHDDEAPKKSAQDGARAKWFQSTKDWLMILTEKTRINRLLINLIDKDEICNDYCIIDEFQMANNQDQDLSDSMALMAEQETQVEEAQEVPEVEASQVQAANSQKEWKVSEKV